MFCTSVVFVPTPKCITAMYCVGWILYHVQCTRDTRFSALYHLVYKRYPVHCTPAEDLSAMGTFTVPSLPAGGSPHPDHWDLYLNHKYANHLPNSSLGLGN